MIDKEMDEFTLRQQLTLCDYLDEDESIEFNVLLFTNIDNDNGKREQRLAELMRVAANRHHEKNYPHSPICQWILERLDAPYHYWLEQAVEKGNKDLLYDYLIQHERIKDEDFIASKYEELANDGNSEAADRLAYLYKGNSGMNSPAILKRDLNKSLLWYQKALELNHKDAPRNIVWTVREMYKEGLINKQNELKIIQDFVDDGYDDLEIYLFYEDVINRDKHRDSIIAKQNTELMKRMEYEYSKNYKDKESMQKAVEIIDLVLQIDPNDNEARKTRAMYKKTLFRGWMKFYS